MLIGILSDLVYTDQVSFSLHFEKCVFQKEKLFKAESLIMFVQGLLTAIKFAADGTMTERAHFNVSNSL